MSGHCLLDTGIGDIGSVANQEVHHIFTLRDVAH